MRGKRQMKEYSGATPRDQQNRKRYTWLLALWALVYLASTYLITFELSASTWRWIAAGAPSLFAIFAAAAYWRFLQNADELARAIELKALALAVAVGFVVWPASTLLAASGAPISGAMNPTVLLMVACYSYGVIKGRSDYR
jgi:hypothetical protein